MRKESSRKCAASARFETPTQKTRRKAKANAKRGRTKFRFNPS
jgi:hypothetical protein